MTATPTPSTPPVDTKQDSLSYLRGVPAETRRPDTTGSGPHPLALAVALAAAVGLVMLAFLWPTVTSEPRDVPILTAGQNAEQTATRLEQNADGRFEVGTVVDRAEAVDALERRKAYGAVVMAADPTTGAPAPEILVAGAASPAVAQSLRQLGPALEQQVQAGLEKKAASTGAETPQVSVRTTDVVPLSTEDPTGTGLAAIGFPLVIGGMIGGAGVTQAMRGTRRRLIALGAYVLLAGAGIALIAHAWLGILHGPLWETVLAATLAVASISLPVAGFVAILGGPGIALGAVLFMLFANPIASAAAPQQFLPGAWGAIGQAFPPGASAHLMRTLSYFPEASASAQWWTLGAWALCGLLLVLLGGRRGRP